MTGGRDGSPQPRGQLVWGSSQMVLPCQRGGGQVQGALTSMLRHSFSFLQVAKMVSDVANSKYQSLFFILPGVGG